MVLEPLASGLVRVEVNGRAYTVDARHVRSRDARQWSLLCNDRGFVCDISDDAQGGQSQVQFRGGGITVRVVEADRYHARRAQAKAGANGPQSVRASIPGKVIRCLVKPGDAVRAGQGLVILEAMKMENELCAAHGGMVQEVAVREGQTVEVGETLVVIDGKSE